jgi:hypothetical protein
VASKQQMTELGERGIPFSLGAVKEYDEERVESQSMILAWSRRT